MKTRILSLTSACALLAFAAHAQKAPPAPPVPGKATSAAATTTNRLELLRQQLAATNAPARPIPTRAVPSTLGKTSAPATTTTTTATTPTSATANATIPTLATGGTAGTKPNAPAIPSTDLIVKASTIRFQNAEMFQVLDYYAELVGRTIIRPANLPNAPISIRAQTDLTKEEAIQALDSVFALNGIVIIPTGEKFLTVVPSAQANQEGAPFSIKDARDLPEASQYITKVVQLKYIHPSEVVPVITPFAKNPTGIVAIESSSVLVLRDFAINIKRMLEVIEEVDKIVPLEENFEVIPIKYALAADISSVLSSLSGGSGGGTTGATTGAGRTSSRTTSRGSNRNSTLPGATGGGGIPGQPGGVNPQQFNQPGGAQPGGNAAFQNRLQQIVQRAAGAGAGGTAPLLGDAKLIPDERMNSILVFANKQDMALVKDIIAKIDVIQPQVLIEAIILEVSLDDGKTLAVSAAQSKKNFLSNFSGFGGSKNGIFQSATNLANNNSLPNGFSYFGQIGKNWEVALQAIATDNTVNVLSRPRIQTSHAETATLFIGDTVPYVTGTYFGGVNSGSSSQYQQKEVGINLSVLPLINTDGLVVMDIQQNIEQLGPPQIIDNNAVPTTTKRTASAKVMVQDGETIILGGFISSTKSKSKSGIPYLKDIPYLGALFRSTTESNKRVELIVLMRPTVLKTPSDASLAATVERERLSGVQRAEMEISEEEKKLADKNKSKMKRMKSQDGKNPPATSIVPPPPATRIVPPTPEPENK